MEGEYPMNNRILRTISTVLIVVMLMAGVAFLLYPSLYTRYEQRHEAKAQQIYAEALSETTTIQTVLDQAETYNQSHSVPIATDETYSMELSVESSGIMGYIDIPSIDVSLPIYHGDDDSALRYGAQHIEWTSLPVGGEGTHCGIAAHSGNLDVEFFRDLEKLELGDSFTLRVMGETLVYEVDQIMVVDPQDSSPLMAEPGEDYCTLVTCTPTDTQEYRLLVRGRRK